MTFDEIKLLIGITSKVITTFTTEQNIQRLSKIKTNVKDMTKDTVKFAEELLKDSHETAKIVEALIIDLMTSADLQAPRKISSRGIDNEILRSLRKEIQTQFTGAKPQENEKVATD